MKIFRMGILGLVATLGLLGCGMFSGASVANVSPTVTRILATPTALPLPTAVPVKIPTQVPIANSQTYTLSETDLNQQLSQNLPQDAAVSNVYLDLHAGNTANVSATLRVNALTLQPNALVRVAVVNGRIAIEIAQVNVGGFGVPSSMIEPQVNNLKTMAENELNKQLAVLEKNSGFKLQAITTTENDMTLYFGQ